MPTSSLRLLLFTAMVATLAGCGGSPKSSGGGSGGGNPTLVTYTFSFPTTAVATQIGTGPYTLATVTSGKLTLSIPSGESNFSVAYLCPLTPNSTPPQYFENIRQASILDGTSYTASCFQASTTKTGTVTAQVNAAAIPGTAWIGGEFGEAPWTGSTVVFNSQLSVGTYDIPVSAAKNVNFFDNYLAIRILRAQTVPGTLNNGDPVVFTAGDEVQPQTITYANLPAGFQLISPFVTYQTGSGTEILLDLDGPSGQYLAVPSGSTQSGDSYFFGVGAYGNPNSSIASETVGIERRTSTGGPQSFTLPAPWSYAGPTPASLPTFNFAYSGFSGSSDVSNVANVIWLSANGNFNEIAMVSTSNYQNGSTALTTPNLSSLTGFLTPPTSGTVDWTAEIIQGKFTGTTPPTGTVQYVGNNGTYTLP